MTTVEGIDYWKQLSDIQELQVDLFEDVLDQPPSKPK